MSAGLRNRRPGWSDHPAVADLRRYGEFLAAQARKSGVGYREALGSGIDLDAFERPGACTVRGTPVSYTHLDVYKRQPVCGRHPGLREVFERRQGNAQQADLLRGGERGRHGRSVHAVVDVVLDELCLLYTSYTWLDDEPNGSTSGTAEADDATVLVARGWAAGGVICAVAAAAAVALAASCGAAALAVGWETCAGC